MSRLNIIGANNSMPTFVFLPIPSEKVSDYFYFLVNPFKKKDQLSDYCPMGLFVTPSGDGLCWSKDSIRNKFTDAVKDCVDNGYHGLTEFYTQQDFQFFITANYCKSDKKTLVLMIKKISRVTVIFLF